MSRGAMQLPGRQRGFFVPMWVGAVIGLVTTAYSARQKRKQQREARQAGRRRDDVTDLRRELVNQNIAMGEQLMGDYRRNYAPLHESLAGMVEDTPSQEQRAAEVRADVGQQFDQAREERERRNLRYGAVPGTGMRAEQDRRSSLDEARAEVGLADAAKERARDERWGRTGEALRYGQGLFSSAMGTLGQTQGTLADLSDLHGRDMMYHRDQSGGYGRMMGTGLGMLSDWAEGVDWGGDDADKGKGKGKGGG